MNQGLKITTTSMALAISILPSSACTDSSNSELVDAANTGGSTDPNDDGSTSSGGDHTSSDDEGSGGQSNSGGSLGMGGTPAGSGGNPGSPPSVESCAPVERFSGPQTVDGEGDEFSDISPRIMMLEDGNAELRIAWSEDGLHLHARVPDNELLGSISYSGDNVQLFYTTSPPVGGTEEPKSGEGAVYLEGGAQLAMNAPPREASVITTFGMMAVESEVANRATDDGYEIELFHAWTPQLIFGTDPPMYNDTPGTGDTIGMDLQIGDLDSDTPAGMYGVLPIDYEMFRGSTLDPSCEEKDALFCDTAQWCEVELL